jgi:thiamine biosynthesis lipoprotein
MLQDSANFPRDDVKVEKNRGPKKFKIISLMVVVLLLGLLGFRAYNSYRFHLEKQTRFMMDTYVTIYGVGPKKATSRAIDLAMKRMQEIDSKFNMLNPRSPLYAFNHQGVPISDPEIIDVIRAALEVARKSDGAFDITISPLVELWGFYGDSPHLPQEEQVRECLNHIGSRYLVLDDGTLKKTEADVRIDLGGIAKGYAISQAVKVLKAQGVTSALIDAGGDVYAMGKRGNKPWKVGIRSPRGEELLGYVEVEDLAVMGSGDYERFFMKDGKRYHHIFDPKTGYPAQGLSGTTLIYPDPMLADAWNTALFVLGPKKGLEIVEKTPAMETIMVTTEGKALFSSGMKNALKVIPKG